MITIIYLIRHAELDNPEKLFYSRLPGFELTKRGIIQAEQLNNYFKDIKIDAAYSSPLQRAKKTAQIITDKRDIKLQLSDLLPDWYVGPWSGKKVTSLNQKDVNLFFNDPLNFNLPDSETLQDVRKRMCLFLESVLEKHKGKTVLAVSHAGPMKILLYDLENKPFGDINKIRCPYASIIRLEFEEKKFIKAEKIEITDEVKETIWSTKSGMIS